MEANRLLTDKEYAELFNASLSEYEQTQVRLKAQDAKSFKWGMKEVVEWVIREFFPLNGDGRRILSSAMNGERGWRKLQEKLKEWGVD